MKKKETDDLGFFNILLIGKNPHAISIADNIKSRFQGSNKDFGVINFNIVDDIEIDIKSNSWFNEFIFDLTNTVKFNNIIISEGFSYWMTSAKPMERLYMKKLLQAMNMIIIDISDSKLNVFDVDIPQSKFDVQIDFIEDTFKWIDEQIMKVIPSIAHIRLIRSLCGKNIPYLGDVYGCLSNKKYDTIIHSEYMRFDVPILFDEFCKLSKGREISDIDNSVITRSSSALSVFFK